MNSRVSPSSALSSVTMDDIEIQVWPEAAGRYEEMLEGWYNFWRNEPLNASIVGELTDERGKEKLAEMLRDQLSEKDMAPCVIAYDKVKQQVAGFVIASIGNAEHKEPYTNNDQQTAMKPFSYYAISPSQSEQMSALENFLGLTATKVDLFKRYNVDRMLHIMITTVRPEYTRRGIANIMTGKMLEVAADSRCSLVVAVSTSTYTQRNKINRFQFEKVIELDFENNYPNFSSMPEKTRKAHDKVCVLAKRL